MELGIRAFQTQVLWKTSCAVRNIIWLQNPIENDEDEFFAIVFTLQ